MNLKLISNRKSRTMEKQYELLVITFLTVINYCTASSNGNKCIYIQLGTEYYQQPVNCNKTRDVCGEPINVIALVTPPYSDDTLVKTVLQNCCKGCPRDPRKGNDTFTPMLINKNLMKNFMRTILEIGHFIYPFLGAMDSNMLYGRYFIPVFPVPTLFYVTRNDGDVLGNLITTALNLYPLVVICITLAIISGFIIWSLETWFNETEFPRPFFRGWFEGFWWSFISMTTVGYGDKTPKKVVARIFSVIWIITGIALFNIVTGEITTILVQANNPPAPIVRGKTVGVLSYRDYDKSYVTKNGGLVYHVQPGNFSEEVLNLSLALKHKKIDGIIFDKSTLYYIQDIIQRMTTVEKKTAATFLINETLRFEKEFIGEKMAYGVIVKYKRHYDYFSSALADNRLSVISDKEAEWNRGSVVVHGSHDLFSPEGYYFVNGMIWIWSTIGVIIVFGVIFEMKRRDFRIFNNNDPPKYEMNPTEDCKASHNTFVCGKNIEWKLK